MNNKFKLATKRITAVAASAALVSSAVVGAPLANYPMNFVQDGEFQGTVVVGSGAAASDMTAAESLIDDLASEFSGDSEKVKISYSMSDVDGESISAVDDRETLNIGEDLATVAADFDDTSSDMFEDGDLDGDVYNQELVLQNGDFKYQIFDTVDGETVAKYGLYYGAGEAFANYTVSFEDTVDISNPDDLVGEQLTIMGNEFTIESIDNNELVLIGGSNEVSLGAGESQTVTVDGQDYEVEVLDASTEKAQIVVNGQSISIDEFSTEEVAGVNVAVTDVFSTDRTGYATLVIGGQKVSLTTSGVEINEEDLDDVHEDYQVDVAFKGTTGTPSTFEGFTLTYSTDENVVLGDGVTLNDVLFDSFELMYEGVNDVEYSTTTLSTTDAGVTFDATLDDGEALPSEFELVTDDVTSEDLYLGSRNKRIFFDESDLTIDSMIDVDRTRAMSFNSSANTVTFNITDATSDIQDNMFFTRIDDDESYLYQISSVDRDESQLDFEDLLSGESTNTVDYNEIDTTLELANANVFDSATASSTNQSILNVSLLGDAKLRLENDLEMDFSEIEVNNLTSSNSGTLSFSYNSDIDMDNQIYENDTFQIEVSRASDFDDPLTLSVTGSDWKTEGEETEDNSEDEVYVDAYGTMVTVQSEDDDSAEIKVPSEEVHGQVSLVFGESSSESGSVTVDADAVEATKEDLIAEGYTITDEESVSIEEVEFDVEAPIMDTEADVNAGNHIVIGGPAVNAAARAYLGIDNYTVDQAGVSEGEGIARYFEDANSVLIYGYSAADTAAIVTEVNAGTANFE